MDLIMPGMDGVEATRRIMARKPCAIVVVTANVRDHSSKVFEAMGAGALDAVNTPVLERPGACDGAEALLAKIETIRKLIGAAAQQEPVRSATGRRHPQPADAATSWSASAPPPAGPRPWPMCCPICRPTFPRRWSSCNTWTRISRQGLANWLDEPNPLHVRLAREGDRPQAGTVLLAGQDNHLVFASPTGLSILARPRRLRPRPSIDLFFKSADRFWPGDVIGVLLTGMGRDGAEGLRALRASGPSHHRPGSGQQRRLWHARRRRRTGAPPVRF